MHGTMSLKSVKTTCTEICQPNGQHIHVKEMLAFISTVYFEHVILFYGRQKNNFPYST